MVYVCGVACSLFADLRVVSQSWGSGRSARPFPLIGSIYRAFRVRIQYFFSSFFTKKHTPFDSTKQQGSDETLWNGRSGERQGQLDRP